MERGSTGHINRVDEGHVLRQPYGGNGSVNILLVEDNPSDEFLTKEILRESEIRVMIKTVKDGMEAIEYLYRCKSYGFAVNPDVILLDQNLPRMNGFELLEEIQGDRSLRTIPVFMLTTSNTEDDIAKAETLHVTAYLSKPLDLREFEEAILHLRNNIPE